jgi:outer membrane protein TolC
MVAVLVAALVWGAAPPQAEAPAPPAALTLEEALQAAQARGTAVRLAERELESRRGGLLASRAPFDTTLQTTVAGAHHGASGGLGTTSGLASGTMSYGVSLRRDLRNGLSLAQELAVRRDRQAGALGTSRSEAEVALTLAVPLLRDRGGAVSGAPERAADGLYQASALALSHRRAEGALDAALGYWDLVAAERRTEVLAASEERAERLAAETRTLVDAEERARTDLAPVLGNLASKRAARILAEQEVTESWRRLALAMGREADGAGPPPRAATPFPAAELQGAPADLEALAREALGRRADLAAVQKEAEAASVRVQAARHELGPRLDLVARAGYLGRDDGPGLGRAFTPLYRDVRGVDASVELRLELPGRHSGARGRLLQSSAAHEQQRLQHQDLARRVRAGVWAAGRALGRSRLALAEAREAVRLLHEAVQNEQLKFQMGVSTLFEVLQAQDRLTGALLDEIASQRAHAAALALLRFETAVPLEAGAAAAASGSPR